MTASAKMYVVAHKPFRAKALPNYRTIAVGKYVSIADGVEVLADNTGDNISEKNFSYCELTALYWFWKNDFQSRYVGLSHYRRYFCSSILTQLLGRAVSVKKLIKILRTADIVVPKKFVWSNRTVRRNYYDFGCGYSHDLDTVRDIIAERSPEYLDAYDELLDGNSAHYLNMFFASKQVCDDYCRWLFDLLAEAERRIDISDYTDAERRVFGYLSELLINVWIRTNRLTVVELPVLRAEESMLKRIKGVSKELRSMCFGRAFS